MFKKFLKWMEENRDYGMTLWLAYDPVSQKASITLLMAYISFILACIGNIIIWFKADPLLASLVNILFCSLMVVFYMIRSINKAKFDLESKSFEISNKEE